MSVFSNACITIAWSFLGCCVGCGCFAFEAYDGTFSCDVGDSSIVFVRTVGVSLSNEFSFWGVFWPWELILVPLLSFSYSSSNGANSTALRE